MIRFLVDAQANHNAPVAVDLVAVSDPGLLQKLGRLSAWEWFDRRKQLQQDDPFHIRVWSWEIVPGANPAPFEIPDAARDSLGILLFADYQTPGLHRARIGPFEQILLHLQREDLRVKVIRRDDS